MRVVVRELGAFFRTQTPRLVLVQLGSPFSGPDRELEFLARGRDSRFEWNDPERVIPRREGKVGAFLDLISNRDVDILVFPEYAVPEVCHPRLQRFADEKHCIVVGGSYYDSDHDSPTFRHNVAKIFTPGSEPLAIAKRHGFRQEERALVHDDAIPNVARLVVQTDGDRQFALNIYLCRDYVIPYTDAETGKHESVLDWENPGISLVLMCSTNIQLFKGQAAFEVRRMRGHGKFVALCNCSGVDVNGARSEGSALLGPSETLIQGAPDTIAQLAGDGEGYISARLRLSEVAVQIMKPDTTSSDPVEEVTMWSLDWHESTRTLTEGRPRVRDPIVTPGVWHPAFLEAIGRDIAIQLIEAKDFIDGRQAIKDRLYWVTARVLRGQHDFMVRFYTPRGKGSGPVGLPYSVIAEDKFGELFSTNSMITLLVKPEGIFKYRSVVVPGAVAWRQAVQRIRQYLGQRGFEAQKEVLATVCRLARDWNAPEVPEALRAELAGLFFMDRLGISRPVPSMGSPLRQTYVLIDVFGTTTSETQRLRELFQREIVVNWLLNLDEVRSIYGVQATGPIQWDYWLDIGADPMRTDQIIDELHFLCRGKGIRIGTRSMDVMEPIKTESVEGVAKTDLGEALEKFLQVIHTELQDEIKTEDLDVVHMCGHEDVARTYAAAWSQHVDVSGGWVSTEEYHEALRFYANLFFGTFAKARAQDEYRIKACNVWEAVYQAMEDDARTFLTGTLGGEYLKSTERHFREKDPKGNFEPLRVNEVRLTLWYLSTLPGPQREEYARLRAEVDRQQIYEFRNELVHGRRRRLIALDVLGEGRGAAARVEFISETFHGVSRARRVFSTIGGGGDQRTVLS